MDNSPLVQPLGRSPEFVEASLRFWKRVVLCGGTLAVFGLAGGIVHSGYRAGSEEPVGVGLLAAGVLLPMVYGVWRVVRTILRSSGSLPDALFKVVLNDRSVAFRRRNRSETVVDYADIDGVAAVYAGAHKNYDELALWLFDAHGSRHAINNLHSDGETVEALAEAIRVRVRAAGGDCRGDREFDRSLRRAQRDTPSLNRKWMAFYWLMSLGFLFVVIVIERDVWRESEVLSSGVAATGLTTAIHPGKGYNLIEYEFRDAAEMRHTGRGRLQWGASAPLLLHGPVDVVYLPDSPDRNLPAEHFSEAAPAARVLFWMLAVLMVSGMVLVSSGRDMVFLRGRAGLLRRHELEEEWWERVGGAG